MEIIIVLLIVTAALLGSTVFAVMRLRVVAGPQELLVKTMISVPATGGHNPGMNAAVYDGFAVIKDGWALINPFVDQVERMDISPIDIDEIVDEIRFCDDTTAVIHLKAKVAFDTELNSIPRSIERFLGRPRSEVCMVAEKIVINGVRQVASTLSREEFFDNTEKVSSTSKQTIEMDMENLGFQLESLDIDAS